MREVNVQLQDMGFTKLIVIKDLYIIRILQFFKLLYKYKYNQHRWINDEGRYYLGFQAISPRKQSF